MASVDFDKVTRRYAGGATALAALDLNIADGELLVLVGPSGCGKSTALRLLAGLDDVTEGKIAIGERDVTHLPPQQRNIAMVFQDYALYPHMTVRANLEFPLRMHKMAPADIAKRVAWAVEVLDMGAWLERLPRQLSGGQRQRVAMGRALVREPSVFLLDEPLSNLDAKLRGQVRTEIAHLQQRTGTTMIYVTHDQVEAMTLGHRVAILNKGRLQQLAPPQTIYARPANTFVAAFVGSPPMNLLPAEAQREGERTVVLRIDGHNAVRIDLDPGVALPASPITAGIRPEDWRIVASGGADAGVIARVTNREFLGHETLIHASSVPSGHALVVRVSLAGTWAVGSTICLAIDPQAVRLFDADGHAIS